MRITQMSKEKEASDRFASVWRDCDPSISQNGASGQKPPPRFELRKILLRACIIAFVLALLLSGFFSIQQVLSRQVRSITLSHDALKLDCTETALLTCSIHPASASDKKVTWISSDESIAVVDSDGRITGIRAGSCTVTAAVENESASAAITVSEPDLIWITLPKVDGMEVGDTLQLTFDAYPPRYKDLAVNWRSSNPQIAVVDENGLVTFVGSGKCRIYVEAYDWQASTDIRVYHLLPQEKQLLGQWHVTQILHVKNGTQHTPRSEARFVFKKDKTGVYTFEETTQRFRWNFLEEKTFCFNIGIYLEDGTSDVISVYADKLTMEVNGYLWELQPE